MTGQTATMSDMESTYGGKGILFHGKTDAGRDIGVRVSQETIEQLAEYAKIAGSVGHALWHIQNKASKFPCESCGNHY
jgi:Holliday junction resolvase